MILGDSLVVMNSLLHYEGLGGQIQMIYMDPPYGVKFGSRPTLPIARLVSATPVPLRCCSSSGRRARPLVLVGGHHLGEHRGHAQSGSVLLDGHHSPQTLGTALGDWIADTRGLGYEGGALVFAAGLAIIGGLYLWTNVSSVFLFWSAFILTRPLGATVGDFLDKPVSQGGLAFSRPLASAVIAMFIIGCLLVLPQRAGRHPGASLRRPPIDHVKLQTS